MSRAARFVAFPASRRLILVAFFALVLFSPDMPKLDLYLSDAVYDFAAAEWAVTDADRGLRLIFYSGGRAAVVVIASMLILALAFVCARPAHSGYLLPLLLTIFGIAMTVSTVSLLKHQTDVYCPSQITRYGGDQMRVGVLDTYPAGLERRGRGRCWPAGHAAGGFALMSLVLLGRGNRQRRLLLLSGFSAGWVMGVYQMLRGNHYLSHTVISLLIAWAAIEFLVIARPYLAGIGARLAILPSANS
jgi:membrane-associated PAP2 superfamily phosphatase